MIKLLLLECFSLRAAVILLINEIHEPHSQWHFLYFAYGKHNKSYSCRSYHINNELKRTDGHQETTSL